MSTSFARSLRQQATPAEARFWVLLYTFRQAGWHFRRQAPIGPYITDFACKRAGLIFEIDGDSHYSDEGLAADSLRTAYLQSRGYRVFRFTNGDVMTNPEGVFDVVNDILQRKTPS